MVQDEPTGHQAVMTDKREGARPSWGACPQWTSGWPAFSWVLVQPAVVSTLFYPVPSNSLEYRP